MLVTWASALEETLVRG